MKSFIQRILQSLLGYKRYLWVFTLYKLRVLKKDTSERDFFHFLEMLPPNSHVLDIGANLGLMTFFLAKKCAKVDAFEPIPSNADNLRRLISDKNLNNVELHQIALGETSGEIELVLPTVDGVVKQGLSHVRSEKMKDFNEGTVVKAKVSTLDDLQEIQDQPIHGIKIDVENFEFEVFKGAINTIKKYKPLIYCELWDNQNRYDCFDLLTSIDYDIFELVEGKLIRYESDESHGQNFFFIPMQS